MEFALLIFLLLGPSLVNYATADHKDSKPVVTLVVIGANGDLAKRKIWPSLQELLLYHNNDSSSYTFPTAVYAATREPVEETSEMFNNYFQQLPCHTTWSLSDKDCLKLNSKLAQIVQPIQLKNSSHYRELNRLVKSEMTTRNTKEFIRIFYLSVPPFAYSAVCNYIHSFVRPYLSKDTQLRIAIEKPFGSDFLSAKNLSDEILNFMTEKEIFLVDHYLHKLGTQNILTFCQANPRFFSSPSFINQVEVVVRESLDVKGRTGYYNQYGVIRDMIQNHLTELLTLLISDLTNLTSKTLKILDLNTAKFNALQSIYPPFTDSAVLGQYYEYREHLLMDTGTLNNSNTPTFAAVLVNIRSFAWMGVPIVLMSGKRLGKREAFVRVSFKKPMHLSVVQQSSTCSNDVIFDLDKSCIIVPTDHRYIVPEEWISTTTTITGDCNVIELCPMKESQSTYTYSSVLKSLFEGNSDLFVPLRNVLESWKVWSPLIEELSNEERDLLTYNDDLLNGTSFTTNGTSLHIKHSTNISHHGLDVDVNKFGAIWNETQTSHHSLNITHTLSRTKLSHEVAKDIYYTAINSIYDKNSFHIALPGGSSPLGIYQSILVNYRPIFPWSLIHLWQTDERCVPLDTVHSNMYQLSMHLIEYIPIPYSNIHPLYPACNRYSESLLYQYNESSLLYHPKGLDYVLLGVGKDGHIASLFPNITSATLSQDGPIQYVSLPSNHPTDIKKRVSLTMTSLLKARTISMLLMGYGKCHLYKLLQETLSQWNYHGNKTNSSDLPFIQIIKRSPPGTVKVWIDKDICKE